MRRFSRAAAALLLSAGAAAATTVTASAATSVAYLDGKEIWLSSLDGAQKARLTGGEGDWTAVAQNAGGWIVGIELEAGKIATLSRFTIWNPQGKDVYHGPLASKPGASLYAYPLGLAVTADGRGLVYGYSEYTSGYPVGTLRTGFYVLPSETVVAPALGPVSVSSAQFVTLGPGDRVVGTMNGRTIGVQQAGSLGNTTFDAWNGLGSNPPAYTYNDVSVAADGTTLAATVVDDGPTSDDPSYINLARHTTFGPLPAPASSYVDDCMIELQPTTRASHPSVSPDGTRVAWQDAGGVKIAGVPNFASGGPAICQLSSPPVTLSASGSYPSIGGFDLAALIASRTPVTPGGTGGTGSTGGTGGGTGAPAALAASVTGTPKVSTAPSAGVPFKVVVNASGKATLKLTITPKVLRLKGTKPITLGTGSGTVTAGKPATVKVRLSARGTSLRRKLKGKKAQLTVTVGGTTTTITVKLG